MPASYSITDAAAPHILNNFSRGCCSFKPAARCATTGTAAQHPADQRTGQQSSCLQLGDHLKASACKARKGAPIAQHLLSAWRHHRHSNYETAAGSRTSLASAQPPHTFDNIVPHHAMEVGDWPTEGIQWKLLLCRFKHNCSDTAAQTDQLAGKRTLTTEQKHDQRRATSV